MRDEATFKIRGWESTEEKWRQFLVRIIHELFLRTRDAISPDWCLEQLQIFKLKRTNTHQLHAKVLSIIQKALLTSGLFDAFSSRESIAIALQIAKGQTLLINKNHDSKKIFVDFTFKIRSGHKTFHIGFDKTPAGFGDITSTNVSHHFSSGGGGGGPAFPDRMFSHIAGLLLCKPQVKDVRILGVESFKKIVTSEKT